MIAEALSEWVASLSPTEADLALADAALVDTLAVAHGQVGLGVTAAARLAAAAHVLDFDDLHLASTTHISAVCVPATLAVGGGAREYLVAAGVMARLGTALGWEHYARGWHATCTAGALAVAAGAAAACGADVATAMALAVPAAGGVQRAFGTDAKALQVGFAVEAGLRAADLAAGGGTRAGAALGARAAGSGDGARPARGAAAAGGAGRDGGAVAARRRPATADPSAVDAWLELLGGDPARLVLDGPAIPGGLAVKLYPCCYALQRPIEAARGLPRDVEGPIVVRTPASTVTPLIHARPRTGLEGKFSLQYAIATALLDDPPGFDAFSDAGVKRPEAQRIVELVDVRLEPGGTGLLDGEVIVEAGGERVALQFPLGSPQRPASAQDLAAKRAMCGAPDLNWSSARRRLEPPCA